MANWKVTIRPAAKLDIRQARDWYKSQDEGLSTEFLEAIAAGTLRLQIAPDSQPFYYRQFRRLI